MSKPLEYPFCGGEAEIVEFVEPRCDQGYTDLEPNFCPKCGVDFREEGDLIG